MTIVNDAGFKISGIGEVTRTLLERAERLEREGSRPPHVIRTGLPDIDARVRSWWGCITLTGAHRVGKTALALRFAAETAEVGGAVLWLCMAGDSELAALRLLTSKARVRLRKLMVDRTLTEKDWAELRRVGAEIEGWPIQFGDARAATVDELEAVCRDAATRVAAGGGHLDLVIIDSVRAPDRPALRRIGLLSLELDAPIVAAISEPVQPHYLSSNSPLEDGTLSLHLESMPDGGRYVSAETPRPVMLHVCRVGGNHVCSVPLRVVPAYRSVEP